MAGIGVLTVFLAAVPTAARAGGATYVSWNCLHVRQTPKSILLACADAGWYVNHLTWGLWGTNRASGRGVFHQNDCKPSCAGGSFHSRRGRIVLSTRIWCKRVHKFVFSRAVITYDRPLLGRKRTKTYLFCPFP
jgi:hypothetical protein